MGSIERDPGLKIAEENLLARLTYVQKRDVLLWLRLEKLYYSITERQQWLDKRIDSIRTMIVECSHFEVDLSDLEEACWIAHNRIDDRCRKLQLEREVVENRMDDVFDRVKSYESEPAEFTWYLWCKAGYMDYNSTRYEIMDYLRQKREERNSDQD